MPAYGRPGAGLVNWRAMLIAVVIVSALSLLVATEAVE
jgi:hypothetical protein